MTAIQSIWDGADVAELMSLRAIGPDLFVSQCNQRNIGGEIFGGQYLGQTIVAAMLSADRRAPHAMTGHFLHAARADQPLELRVERLREGRSFAHRRVQIVQADKLVFVADVSLHDAEPGQPGHQMPAPAAPAPEQLQPLAALAEQYGSEAVGPLAARIGNAASVEVRPVDPEAGMIRPGPPVAQAWLRARCLSSDDPVTHYGALAFMSDFWGNAPSRLPHGRTLFAGEITSLSLNHAIWFHRQPQAADWLLYALDGPATAGGTGLNRGLLYDRSGTLIASAVQEALVRYAQPER
jgi:acyl-CoA thioesterase-2